MRWRGRVRFTDDVDNDVLVDIVSANGTHVRGVDPSVFTMRCIPQDVDTPVGRVVFEYESLDEDPATLIALDIYDCAVINTSIVEDTSGGQLMNVTIHDRRWKWKFGGISGRYNQKDAQGNRIAASQKNARELGTLLLTAMGEDAPVLWPAPDITKLPEDQYPEVKWYCDNPADALAQICKDLGFEITISVAPATTGQLIVVENNDPDAPDLPTGNEMHVQQSTTNLVYPDEAMVCPGPTEWELLFVLEAVALDYDATGGGVAPNTFPALVVKPVGATLSYWDGGSILQTPEGCEAVEDLQFTIADNQKVSQRQFAKRSLFRWFRPKELAAGLTKPPLYPEPTGPPNLIAPVTDMGQYVFLRKQLRKNPGLMGELTPMKAQVFGEHVPKTTTGRVNSDETAEVKHSFSIDKNGLVKFTEPVYKVLAGYTDVRDIEYSVPTLYLRCAVQLKTDDHQLYSEKTIRDIKGARPSLGASTRIVKAPKIKRQIAVKYDDYSNVGTPPLLDNRDETDEDIKGLLDAEEKRFAQAEPGVDKRYAGLVLIETTGQTVQVSFSIDTQGGMFTRASRKIEHDKFVASERKRNERHEYRKGGPITQPEPEPDTASAYQY